MNNLEITSPEAQSNDRLAIFGRDGRRAAGWALRFIIVVAAFYVLWRLLGYVWVGLLPVFLALLVTTVLWPVNRFLRNHKVPSSLAALISIVGSFLVFAGIIALIAPTVATQGQDLVQQARAGVNDLIAWVESSNLFVDAQQLDGVLNDVMSFLKERSSQIATGVASGVSIATSIVVTILMTLVLTFFFLKDGDRFLPTLRRFTGNNAGAHVTELLTRVWNTLAGYIRAQAAVSLIDAVFIGLGLILLGIPMALALAVITFVAGFIPIVGAVSAGALAVIIALVTHGVTKAILVLVLIIAVQQIEGNVLSPILQSKAMNLHPAIVLLSVTVGSTLFGIIGAFLAVPVAATVAVCIRYHAETVALRAGEISLEDIDLATNDKSREKNLSGRPIASPFAQVRHQLGKLTAKDAPTGSEGEGPAEKTGKE